MKFKRFGDTFAVRVQRGEDIVEALTRFCEEQGIEAAAVTGIGAVGLVEMGFYDFERQEYVARTFEGDYEITGLMGNVALKEGKVMAHLHVTIADLEEFKAFGGHLNKGRVSVTAELMVKVIPGTLERIYDEETGLYLWDV